MPRVKKERKRNVIITRIHLDTEVAGLLAMSVRDVRRVTMTLIEIINEKLCKGASVRLDNLGTLKPGLRPKNKKNVFPGNNQLWVTFSKASGLARALRKGEENGKIRSSGGVEGS